jgi:hypothetical protein
MRGLGGADSCLGPDIDGCHPYPPEGSGTVLKTRMEPGDLDLARPVLTVLQGSENSLHGQGRRLRPRGIASKDTRTLRQEFADVVGGRIEVAKSLPDLMDLKLN